MAYTATLLSAAELSLKAEGKSILSALNLRNIVRAQWSATGAATFASADITDTDGAAIGTYDGFSHLLSFPNTSGIAFSFLLEFNASVEYDWIGIINHDLVSQGANVFQVEIADDSAFSVNLVSLTSFDPAATFTTDQRFARFTLDAGSGAARLTGAHFMRISVEVVGSFTPSIGEIVLCRRRQLKHFPNRPFDDEALRSRADDLVTQSGVINRAEKSRGQRVLNAEVDPDDTDLKADLIAWFAQTFHGIDPFVWSDNGTAEDAFELMFLEDPEFDFPLIAFRRRRLDIRGEEQGPQYLALE